MSRVLKLIIGLGNPTAEYAKTRHNAGFWFVDLLAQKHAKCFHNTTKFNAQSCRISMSENIDVLLFKPMSFINNSGRVVQKIAHFYKIAISNILVVHDELDLDVGVARLKRGGGAGGHNGVQDIITSMGDKNFMRLRLGIGRSPEKQAVSYVLATPNPIERQLINNAIDSALKVIPLVLEDAIEKAMHILHSREQKKNCH